jgi:effector-binding domain-containing protein
MADDIRIVDARPTPFAAVVLQTSRATLSDDMRQAFDRVHATLDEHDLVQRGRAVAVFRRVSRGEVEVEVGVQVVAPFADLGDVVCCEIPGGFAATLSHYGPYAELPGAHQAVLDWAEASGTRLSGVSWEIYGERADDPAQQRTDVFHQLTSASRAP